MVTTATRSRPMIFFRKEGFYPVDFTPRCKVEDHVRLNPGTLKVMDGITGEIVYHAPEVTRAP